MNLLSIGRLGVAGGLLLLSTLALAQKEVPPTCDPNLRVVCEGASLRSAAPAPKTSPENLRVIFRDGLLQIDADNSLLSVTLKALAARTNATLEFPEGMVDEVVFAHIGPAPAREVIAQLLNGSRLNYVISFSPLDPTRVTRLTLTSSDPTSETPVAVVQTVASKSTASQLYGAGFTADSDSLGTVEPIADEGLTEPSSSGADQSSKFAHQDGVKLSGEDLDRMQKAQIEREQQESRKRDQ